jgi:anti-sigma B factor antagonist
MAESYKVEPLNGSPGHYEMTLVGRIYADLAPALRSELDKEDLTALLVNAERLEQIDSSGLGVFVDVLKRIRPDGGRIVFFGLNDNIQRVFEITKLGKVIGVEVTREDAVRSVS